MINGRWRSAVVVLAQAKVCFRYHSSAAGRQWHACVSRLAPFRVFMSGAGLGGRRVPYPRLDVAVAVAQGDAGRRLITAGKAPRGEAKLLRGFDTATATGKLYDPVKVMRGRIHRGCDFK